MRLFSKSGAEYTSRLPAMAEAFAELSARTAVLDGELVFAGADGRPRFYQLMRARRGGMASRIGKKGPLGGQCGCASGQVADVRSSGTSANPV